MDFKISKKSQANLDAWIAKLKEEEQSKKEIEDIKEKEYLEKVGFKNREEVLDWVFSGHKLLEDNSNVCFGFDRGYMLYNKEKDIIEHYTLMYNDIDMPIGMGIKTFSKKEFIKWTEWMEEQKDEFEKGYIPYWRKN